MLSQLNPLKLSSHHPLRKTLGTIIVGVLASAVALGIRVWPLGSLTTLADWFIYDQLWKTRSTVAPFQLQDASVAVINFGDEDLDLMAHPETSLVAKSKDEELPAYGYPWPRAFWGTLVEYLAAAGVREVVFDLQFTAPSAYNHISDDDGEFAASIERVKGVMPVVFAAKLRESKDAAGKPVRRMEALSIPVPEVIRGVVSVEQGTTLRSLSGSIEGEPSLALAALRALKIQPPPWADSEFLLRWYGPAQTFPFYSAFYHIAAANQWQQDGAQGSPSPRLQKTRDELARLKGKIVLIGGSSAASYDLYSTPLTPIYPGVEMHATAIQNMLRDEHTERTPEWAIVLAAVSAAMATAAVTIFPVGIWLRLGAGATVQALLVLAAVVHFAGQDVDWLPLASPLVAAMLGTVGGFVRNYLSEDARRRLMTKAMGQYVSPEVTRRIERRPDDLRLEAEQRVMTCLFSDMAGFTDFSEAADIGVLTRVLNVYMERMSAIVLEEGGTIDKYIGDAIMAFWNAPLLQPDHAARACRAALRMKNAEFAIRDELLADKELVKLLEQAPRVYESVKGMGATALYTRFGVNTGPMNVGNWGSARKFQYTVIGDAVNAAARLEPSNKRYGTRILIAESTAELVRNEFLVRRVDLLRVKGKTKAMAVFELMSLAPGSDSDRLLVRGYDGAFERYAHRDWQGAQQTIANIRAAHPDDGPTEMLASRVEHLRADPPPEGWDGVFVATDK